MELSKRDVFLPRDINISKKRRNLKGFNELMT